MRSFFKRGFSLLLAAAALLASLPCAALAQNLRPAPFPDVSEEDSDAVTYVYDWGLMEPFEDGQFKLWLDATRAELAAALYRLAGEPEAEGDALFPDVDAGDARADAIRWAAGAGLMDGRGDGTFGAQDPVTRRELAVALYRWAKACGYNRRIGSLEAYPDAWIAPGDAAEAAAWAACSGIVAPLTDGLLHLEDAATRGNLAAALLALAAPANSSVPKSAAAKYEALADARRAKILSSPTEIVKSDTYIPGETYTGTAYYVSSSEGNDDNSGTSPDSPWRTVWKLTVTDFQPGDAIFFRRGDMWRECLESNSTGITYSAYGEGPKPVFTPSEESGVGAEKWELWYEGDDGRRIWKFYRDMLPVGGIYLGGTSFAATRAYAYWTGEHYVDIDFTYNPGIIPENHTGVRMIVGGEQRPETSLEDYEFCCMAEPSEKNSFPISVEQPGPIYLRCDAGNPGELYDFVEFCGMDCGVSVREDSVYDNVAVYFWSTFAFWGEEGRDDNVIVQNCELAYGRTTINCYIQSEPTVEYLLMSDGIYGVVRNAIIRNNYAHDNDGSGVTFETGPDNNGPLSGVNFTCSGNLCEYCGVGLAFNDGNDLFHFDNMTITDNIIVNAGYTQSPSTANINCCSPLADLTLGIWGRISAKRLEVSDNVFMRSRRYVLDCGIDSVFETDNGVFFHDNVYIQDIDKLFGPDCFSNYLFRASDPLLRPGMREYLGGENETILILADREPVDPLVGADFTLPAGLTGIEDEAFAGLAMTAVRCPDGLRSIGGRAFANCANLRQIYIPPSVLAIAGDAFEGCGEDMTIYCASGTEAERFALERGYRCVAIG